MLRVLITDSPAALCVTVLERASDDPMGVEVVFGLDEVAHKQLTREVAEYPLDWGRLLIDRTRRQLRYDASRLNSAPVFVYQRASKVEIDWDYSRLLAVAEVEVDWPALLAHVGGVAPYSPRTMVAGLIRSTANAAILMRPEGLDVQLPPPVAPVWPKRPATGADPEALLFDAVKAQLEVRPIERGRTAVEVSGGMDSALSSLAVTEVLGPGVMSVGVQFTGRMGDAQRHRRRLLIASGGFDDLELPAERFAPFGPTSPRRRPLGVLPQDETYPEIFEVAFSVLAKAGIDVLVSGFGGDELYPVYEGEQKDDLGWPELSESPYLTKRGLQLAENALAPYPRGDLQETCWRASAGRAQRLLRHGIWPVYPYHSPELAAFVGCLPWELRRNRTLLRQALTSRVGDGAFTAGYVKEDFFAVALRGVVENRVYLRELVSQSVLLRAGYIDRTKVLESLDGNVSMLSSETFNALFAVLSICCFFSDLTKW